MATEPTSSAPQRILILAGAVAGAEQILPNLRSHSEVRIVGSVDEALTALRAETVDLVLCARDELLPIARGSVRERASAILEGIGLGVCIVSRAGELIWTNTHLQTYPPEVIEAVRVACTELALDLASVPNDGKGGSARLRTLELADSVCLELSVTVLPSADGNVHEVLGLFSDLSDSQRLRARLDAIDSAGRELVALNADETEKLSVPERLELLEQRLIRYCRDLLEFTHFNVLVIDPKTQQLHSVLSEGFSQEALSIRMFAAEAGNGISGHVAATGRSYICTDVARDPLFLPGIEHASSSLTVPLRLVDRVVGVFNVESDQPAAFDDTDRQVAEIFGRYVAIALHTLKLLAVERFEATGQVTADVKSEMAEPLDGLVGELSRLVENPPAPEELRQKLGAIVDRIGGVKKSLQRLGEKPAIRGLLPESPAHDPRLVDRRVLVADDEDIIRETIADILAKAGALPFTARDGDDAVAMLHMQKFDLVLSDIKMPNKNGYEVFAAAKQANPQCPVILITGFGYDPEHNIVRASHEGLSAVLFKPFKVEQLLETIHKALAPPMA